MTGIWTLGFEIPRGSATGPHVEKGEGYAIATKTIMVTASI